MKHFVITHQSKDNQHLNVQDLLPAGCETITGIAVIATVKQESEPEEVKAELTFPQMLITNLLDQDRIVGLFYSYLRTRSSEEEGKAIFQSDILPELVDVLSKGIQYNCLDKEENQKLSERIAELYNTQFTDYLYNEVKLYSRGQSMSNLAFSGFIAFHALYFAYLNRQDVFVRTKNVYKQPKSFEVGNLSLLVNGNSFLLRDYVLTANRKVRNMQKEAIPFHEPLEVNSSLQTVFKSLQNYEGHTLTIRAHIEYDEYK